MSDMLCFDVWARKWVICIKEISAADNFNFCVVFLLMTLWDLMFLRGTVISGIDISDYSYVCSKGLCYVLFKILFWHWKDRTEIWRETKWGRKSSSCLWHCICVDACFVCALCWVSLDEATCPKGVQSVLVSETQCELRSGQEGWGRGWVSVEEQS